MSTIVPANSSRPAARVLGSAACIALISASLSACAPAGTGTAPPHAARVSPEAAVQPLAHDRSQWLRLLGEHASIRRMVNHRQEGDVGIVEATTESDDPVVAARIIEHAKAMQARVRAGARVRIWDGVFKELFERHELVTLEIEVTDRGVRIVESSSDPQTIALLRSHAMGVSEFVRRGTAISGDETRRFLPGSPLPPPEVALGGVHHRFLLAQPDPEQLTLLRDLGVSGIVNYRKPGEVTEFDESMAGRNAGLEYDHLPYKEPKELTGEILDASRAQYRDAESTGAALALHCRTGNRVGPGLAAWLVLDKGERVESALAKARAVGMVDPLYESIVRQYVRAAQEVNSTWTEIAENDLTPLQRRQREQATSARDVMVTRLLAALGSAMSAPGPDGRPAGSTGAVGVCKEIAPKIAQSVSKESGVMIGRTAVRLRNPANSAPIWAESILRDVPDSPRLVEGSDGSLGAILPIRVAAECLACHGQRNEIDPATLEVLASKYPADEATGFSLGDLRGWFWVEVPPNVGASD